MTKIRKEQLADDVVLYCGDCRSVIPTLKGIDLVVSDPPYGIQELVGGYGRTQLTAGAKGNKIDARRVNDLHIKNDKNLDVVTEAFTLARKQLRNAWVAAFYSCRITPGFFRAMNMFREDEYFGEVVWDKRAPGLGTQIRLQHENVAFWRVGNPPQLNDGMSVISYSALRGETRTEGSSHPHEKPDQVMQNIIQFLPGKMVLDCFMGTGSTGAAAIKQKKGFVGVELDPKHFEVALRKVGAALKQDVAFWE